jgi:hypothetical protein
MEGEFLVFGADPPFVTRLVAGIKIADQIGHCADRFRLRSLSHAPCPLKVNSTFVRAYMGRVFATDKVTITF